MSDQTPRAGAEAARLLVSAQQWLRESAPHLAPVDADGAPCSCPLCRAVATVREADPGAVARWVDGAVSALEQVASQAGDTASRTAAAARDAASSGTSPDADAGATDAADDEDAGDDADASASSRGVRRIPLDGAATDDDEAAR